MTYLNEYHRESTQRKLKKMEDWKKSPIGYEAAIRQAWMNSRGNNFSPRPEKKGAWQKDDNLAWDMLPKNVLVDNDGELYVIDAECQRIG